MVMVVTISMPFSQSEGSWRAWWQICIWWGFGTWLTVSGCYGVKTIACPPWSVWSNWKANPWNFQDFTGVFDHLSLSIRYTYILRRSILCFWCNWSDAMNVPTSKRSIAQNWPLPLCVSILRGPALAWDGCDGLISSGKCTGDPNFHLCCRPGVVLKRWLRRACFS